MTYPPAVTIERRQLFSLRYRHGDYGHTDGQTITVDPRLRGRLALEVLLHELLHCLEPGWSEWRVTMAARWLSGHVWASGYRKFPGLLLGRTHGGFGK